MSEAPITSLLVEQRVFAPPEAFRARANVNDPAIYEAARRDPEGFWAAAAEELHWFRPWDRVLEWTPPVAQWFVGGRTNIAYNCLDRHLRTPRRNKAAIIWEGEPGETRVLTYWDLAREVNRCANALLAMGVQRGDRVAIYMPMIPELPIAMLACARIGAPHTVVFGGFSAEALRDRINDAQAKVVITADGGFRRGQIVPLKRNVDQALDDCPTVQKVLIVRRIGDAAQIQFVEGRDRWWHRALEGMRLDCPAEEMDSEDLLYILYTSGTTGKPKGIVHTTGGYMVGTYLTTKWVFDLKEDDVYWCTADIGWVTGHSYIVYGPLLNGATTVMYEGTPDWPERDRFWAIVEKYGVTILYTAPTAIRTFVKWGPAWPARHDLSTLRLLGTVGEPINPEAWIWYRTHIGGDRCPVVDTWWQTETGMILITPLPGLTTLKPGSATLPFPGIDADVVDDQGRPTPPDVGGYLVLRKPWPAMLRGIYGDLERYRQQYWTRFPGPYFTGDGARKDADGYFWLLGRVDDVINVAGHRIGTMEVESALVAHPQVAEAAVVGIAHEIKGQALAAFVTLKEGVAGDARMVEVLRTHVAEKIGAIAKPDHILFTAELPKTRSGKIMRRLLRDIGEGRVLGDTTTLADPSVVQALKARYEEDTG
ncbi:MAG: acetate--CoA ligase [Armatimonadota bacterium]|nr:acetate--CoA ligase [Armatimonadota bacterium]MDR7534595.1 acetate--CoA ligase [Armatimonadota bacterium]MDR7536232.1 acetate--CoA ligase [Armatimonadota bacterium]